MIIPCEVVIKYFIPAIRANTAKTLASKYNFSQLEIASKLGITQAAVSKYLNGKYSSEIKRLENKKFLKKLSLNLAYSIARQKKAKIEFAKEFCKICKLSIRKNFRCEASQVR
jgi:predicted transcriptional regulator